LLQIQLLLLLLLLSGLSELQLQLNWAPLLQSRSLGAATRRHWPLALHLIWQKEVEEEKGRKAGRRV